MALTVTECGKGVMPLAQIIWHPVCRCCGMTSGGKRSTVDGNPPCGPPRMSGTCPGNPFGQNHLPKWEKESENRGGKKL